MTGSPTQAGRFAFPLFALLEGLEQLPGAIPRDATAFGIGRIDAPEALIVRLDRLFDLFFESYWQRHAGLTDIALCFCLNGIAQVEIVRRWADRGEEESIAKATFDGANQAVQMAVALNAAQENESASYLIAVLHLSEGAQVHDLKWCASTAPSREVRLAGVICTFEREDMLARNLTRFAEVNSLFRRLFVINQGKPGIRKRMEPHLGALSSSVTILDQHNFGGAGGFTRGIMESLDHPDITHILLMDDDIDVSPLLLARIAMILAYAGAQDCIGGAMLDLYDPGKLFTCGDLLDPARPAIVNIAPAEPCDVTTDAGRDFIARHHRPDFNGWWCFAFPVAAVRQCGLPLPLFIRGDDVEFGYRLSCAGFHTLSWAGIAVWHMPFRLKAKPWHAFYDRRNMLFLSEAHGRFSRQRLARSAWGSFLNAIVTYDYARAAATVEGISAFNKGTEHLLRWTGEDHAALLQRTRNPSPPERPASVEIPAGGSPSADRAIILKRFLRDLLLPVGRSGRIHAVDAQDWHPRINRRPARLIIRGRSGGPGAYRGYRWRSVLALSARALVAIGILRWARRMEPEKILKLTSPASWQRYLSRPDHNDIGPSCDKVFASRSDNGNAHFQQTEAMSSKSCDPILPKP